MSLWLTVTSLISNSINTAQTVLISKSMEADFNGRLDLLVFDFRDGEANRLSNLVTVCLSSCMYRKQKGRSFWFGSV